MISMLQELVLIEKMEGLSNADAWTNTQVLKMKPAQLNQTCYRTCNTHIIYTMIII